MPQLQAPKVTKSFLPFEKILDIRTSLYQAVAQQKQHLVTNRHNLDLDLQRHHQAGDPTFTNPYCVNSLILEQTCCREVSFESSGPIGQVEHLLPHLKFISLAKAKPELVGKYSRVGSDSTGRIVYKKDSTFLHYAVDVAYKFEAWIFSSSADDLMGEVREVLLKDQSKDCNEKRW